MQQSVFHNLMKIQYPQAQNAAQDTEDDDHIIHAEWRQDANMIDIRQVVGHHHGTV